MPKKTEPHDWKDEGPPPTEEEIEANNRIEKAFEQVMIDQIKQALQTQLLVLESMKLMKKRIETLERKVEWQSNIIR